MFTRIVPSRLCLQDLSSSASMHSVSRTSSFLPRKGDSVRTKMRYGDIEMQSGLYCITSMNSRLLPFAWPATDLGT